MPARAYKSFSKRRNPDVIDQSVAAGQEIANAIFSIPSAVLDQSIKTTLEGKDALKHALNPNQDELRYELLGLAATSRNVIELARIHKWATARGDSELKNVVEARAKDLGLYSRLKENYPRQWNPKRSDRLVRRRTKRNPESGAARFYKKFHGRDSEEELVIETEIHEHEWLGVLGLLCSVVITLPSGDVATIDFDERDAPWLCSSENGEQLYIEGGCQKVDLKLLGFSGPEASKEFIVLGEFSPREPGRRWNLAYLCEKDFDNFETIRYEHDLSESDEGEPKSARRIPAYLEYDRINELLMITGGAYHIELPVLETSPGIEN